MNPELLSIISNILSSIIYDGLKCGAEYLFQSKQGKVTENSIKDTVIKSVTKELEKKINGSMLFDSDVMRNYIEHMQPIQRIYQHIFVAGKNVGISTDDLIKELQADTVQYLRGQGKVVNVLDECEIMEFYYSVVKICDEISASLLDSNAIALVRLMTRQNEDSKKTIVSEINRNSERVQLEMNAYNSDIGQALQKINELISINKNEKIVIAPQKQPMLEEIPYKYQGGSEKEQFVKQVTTNLRKYQWIHIYGKMFTGKTQTLIRVSEHIASYVWITVKGNEFHNVSIEGLNLQDDTVVILDAIPNMANPIIRNKCLQILSECKERKCKLITSGYEDAMIYVKGFVNQNELLSIELEGLTKNEVEEIMRKHNAPEKLFNTKGYNNFVELCKGLPPIVMEVVYRMEDNGWKYDDDVFMTILTRRTDSMEEQMKYLFLEAVNDEEARRLYYRIVYANRAVEKKWIQPIADIRKKIEQPDKTIEILKNRWLYTDGKLYQCPNKILQHYAEVQLKQEEKKEIDEFLVKEITKHALEPLDISDLCLYYSRLENFDALGILCYQLMEQMIQHNVREYPINVEMFWQEMSLPEKMSPFIKILVRAQQLYYRTWRGDIIEDVDIKRSELWNIALDNECKLMVIVSGIKFAIINVSMSLLFFEDFFEKCDGNLYLPEHLKQGYTEIKKIEMPDIFDVNSVFVVYNTMLGLNISQLLELKSYVDIMEKYFTPEQWNEFESIENIDAMILCMLDKTWKNSEDNKDLYLSTIKRFYSLLDIHKTPKLWKSVFHSYLLGYQNIQDYEGAKNLFFAEEFKIKENSIDYLEIIDVMARIAHDNNDHELEKQLFQLEMQVIIQNKVSNLNRITIDSCLIYLERLEVEDRQEIENIRKVMRYIACNIVPQTDYPYLQERLEAEYWMKIYLIGCLETEVSEFLLFIEQLLETYKRHECIAVKSILTKVCHILGYISGKFLRNNAPNKFPDGSDYASPNLRIFWNDVEDGEVVSFWKSEKIDMMYYMCAALGNKYGLNEIENRLFQKMIVKQDFWNKTMESMYRLESYLQMKLLKQNELAKLVYFMKKTYEPQEREIIEKTSEYYFIVREQIVFSVFILEMFHKDVSVAMRLCECLIEKINEQEYDEMGQKYYSEYKKVLRLVINEEADFDLLKEAFFLIQKKPELINMDSGVFPLLLLRAPKNQKDKLKSNIIKMLKSFHFENDFVMKQKIKMIELL